MAATISVAISATHTPAPRALAALGAPRPPHAVAPIPALFGLAVVVPMAVAMVLASSLIGPFIVGLIPFMLVFGFAIGPLVAMVKGDL